MKKHITSFILLAFIMVPMLALAVAANAQTNADTLLWGGYMNATQNATGLGNTDPRTIAGSVINIMLGFLGIIAVIIILYGGFKWMTAAGNEDGISEAKKMIAAGVIGLVIILAAYAIASFVIKALYNATNANGV